MAWPLGESSVLRAAGLPCCDVRTPLAGEPARGGGVWWRARLGGEEYCNFFYRDEYDLVGFLSERGLGESERIFGIFALVVETHKEGDREREGDTERAEQAAGTRNLTNEWINELNFLSTLAEDAYLKERPAGQPDSTNINTSSCVFWGVLQCHLHLEFKKKNSYTLLDYRASRINLFQ